MLENILFGLLIYIGIGFAMAIICTRYVDDFDTSQDKFFTVLVWPLVIIVLIMMHVGKAFSNTIDALARLLPPWKTKKQDT